MSDLIKCSIKRTFRYSFIAPRGRQFWDHASYASLYRRQFGQEEPSGAFAVKMDGRVLQWTTILDLTDFADEEWDEIVSPLLQEVEDGDEELIAVRLWNNETDLQGAEESDE